MRKPERVWRHSTWLSLARHGKNGKNGLQVRVPDWFARWLDRRGLIDETYYHYDE